MDLDVCANKTISDVPSLVDCSHNSKSTQVIPSLCHLHPLQQQEDHKYIIHHPIHLVLKHYTCFPCTSSVAISDRKASWLATNMASSTNAISWQGGV